MKWVLPTAFLHQLPLLPLFLIPLAQAIFGWRKIRLKSAVHFQQGTVSSSPWRVAVVMSMLILPQFCLWCLLMRGPSALFFLLGFSFAVPLCLISVAPILHYVPSPSVIAYLQHRFSMRYWTASVHVCLGFCVSFLLLYQTASLLVSVTAYPFTAVVALLSTVAFLSVALSGHSYIMMPPLLLNLIVIFAGVGVFLYFGIEHVTSFNTIIPTSYSFSESLISTCVGFILSFYHLTTSPLFYQAFFPLSTIHKLRLSLIFFAVFQLFGCTLLYLGTSLFSSFLEKHCSLSYSFSSMFQFIKMTVAHRVESYMVVAAIATVLLIFLQWQLLALTTLIWEEFLKVYLRVLSPKKQLRVLQTTLFIILLVITLLALSIRFLRLPFHNFIPTAALAVFGLCSITTATFLCGYFFPCCNSKGALSSFFITTGIVAGLYYLNILRNGLPLLENHCLESAGNSTLVQRSYHFDRLLTVLAGIPLLAHPIFAIFMAAVICLLVSAATGGQDQMSLDWNLVVFPCTPLMKGRSSSYNKRAIVESESFRFAQQFNIGPQDNSR